MALDTCGSFIAVRDSSASDGMKMRKDNGGTNWRIDIPSGVMSQGKSDMTSDSCVQKW
jgi:hypothetical protein